MHQRQSPVVLNLCVVVTSFLIFPFEFYFKDDPKTEI